MAKNYIGGRGRFGETVRGNGWVDRTAMLCSLFNFNIVLPSFDLQIPLALPHGVKYVHEPTEASNTTHPLGNIALDGCLVVKLLSKSSPLSFAERKHNFKI